MTAPDRRATYRLQFRNGMDFSGAAALAPYLAKLGISHLYASPIFEARPGSTHGYDAVDPNAFDPALGGEEGFRSLVEALHKHKLELLLDIVPNHMGIGADNAWWWDVLAWGSESACADFFDIDWDARAGGTPGKILLPVLGAPYGEVLAAGDLQVKFEPDRGGFVLAYFDHRFPLNPRSWPILFGEQVPKPLRDQLSVASASDMEAILSVFEQHEDSLAVLCTSDAETIHALLEEQTYRLAHWRTGNFMLNWRRFFDITELAGVRVEDPEVFEASHKLILDLVKRGDVQGLRIDHVDGLGDPTGYVERLDQRVRECRSNEEPWILVEKILGPDEKLSAAWPISGTTGYEFLNLLMGLFVDPLGQEGLDEAYSAFAGDAAGFRTIVARSKRIILEGSLNAEVTRLARRLGDLAAKERDARDLPEQVLHQALVELAASFDVYRTYGSHGEFSEADRSRFEDAFTRAESSTSLEDRFVFAFLRRVLLERGPRRPETKAVLGAFEQLTGPAMAKSLEDTAFYRWHRLVALNEVGGEPDHFGTKAQAFHSDAKKRAKRWPKALLATSTHDTKRGEDTRLRILALSEIPQIWQEEVTAWRDLTGALKKDVAGGPAPDPGEEYLFYQVLVGCWPLDLEPKDEEGLKALADRLAAYMQKASREAKLRTAWTAQSEPYEGAVEAFVRGALDPGRSRDFLHRVHGLVARIAPTAALHGLSQLLVKLTAPGIPDIYQGTEGWDLALVDPDNRRPVAFDRLASQLDRAADPRELLANWRDGRVKQWLLAHVLATRALHSQLFEAGGYEAVRVTGAHASRVLAFARRSADGLVVTVAPRLVCPLLGEEGTPLVPADAWEDTALDLGPFHRHAFVDVLADRRFEPQPSLPLSALLADLPVALLESGALRE